MLAEARKRKNRTLENRKIIISFAIAHKLSSIDDLSKFPKYVQIETTARCNANCNICPIRDLERENNAFLMKEELFGKIVKDLLPFSGWIEKLTIQGGGEPLLDKNLEKKIAVLKEVGIKFVSFSSNASLCNIERAETIICSGVDEVSFSVDGATARTFEAIRGSLDFDSCISNIENFIKLRNKINSKLNIRVRMTIQESNAKEFRDFLDFWKRKLSKNDSVYGRLWHSWGNWLGNYSLPSNQNRANLNSKPCTSPFSTFFILSDGRIPLCCQDFNAKILLGNIDSSTIQTIWRTSLINQIRESHLSEGRNCLSICRDCNLWDPSTKIKGEP